MEYTLTIHKDGKQIALKVPEGYLDKTVVFMGMLERFNPGFAAEFYGKVGAVPSPGYTLVVQTGDIPYTPTTHRDKIKLIKLARELKSIGLTEAKQWSEVHSEQVLAKGDRQAMTALAENVKNMGYPARVILSEDY